MTLFDQYPRPWSVAQDDSVDPAKYLGGFTVFDSTGQVVIEGGTFTGDGDAEFNLNRLQAAELVEVVNSSNS